jgi:hypothetical protein
MIFEKIVSVKASLRQAWLETAPAHSAAGGSAAGLVALLVATTAREDGIITPSVYTMLVALVLVQAALVPLLFSLLRLDPHKRLAASDRQTGRYNDDRPLRAFPVLALTRAPAALDAGIQVCVGVFLALMFLAEYSSGLTRFLLCVGVSRGPARVARGHAARRVRERGSRPADGL